MAPMRSEINRLIETYFAGNPRRWVGVNSELHAAIQNDIGQELPRQTVVEPVAQWAGARLANLDKQRPGWYWLVTKEGKREAYVKFIPLPTVALITGAYQGERPYVRQPRTKANPIENLYNRVVRNADLRTGFLAAQDGYCAGCGRRYDDYRCLEVDHVVAIDASNDVAANLQLLCGYCNKRKGQQTTVVLWTDHVEHQFMTDRGAAEKAHAAALAYGQTLMETL